MAYTIEDIKVINESNGFNYFNTEIKPKDGDEVYPKTWMCTQEPKLVLFISSFVLYGDTRVYKVKICDVSNGRIWTCPDLSESFKGFDDYDLGFYFLEDAEEVASYLASNQY